MPTKSGARGRTTTQRRNSRRGMRQRGLPLLDLADELHAIDTLLRTLPDLDQAARLAAHAFNPAITAPADALSRWALAALNLNLDAPDALDDELLSPSHAPNFSDLPNTVCTVLDTARWRILRIAKLLAHAARGG